MIFLTIVRTLQILFKLLPSVLALRSDRKEWTNNRKKTNADIEKYQKNARKTLSAFLDLGPVYIKLGQWLSSRADILPQPYMEELAKLQDDVPVVPFEQVKPIIEKEFGSINSTFTDFESQALSGASLGQVYRAKLKDQKIIVKVKRPGIEKTVEKDLRVLEKILPIGLRFIDPNLRFSAKAMLAQFIETVHEELDYRIESSNLKQIKKNMHSSPVLIPEVYDEYSSKNILTMEYIPGIKITNIKELDAKNIDRTKLVANVHKVFFTMLLRYSIFHADPHPGNIAVTDDGQLILYDYGMVGKLDDDSRRKLVRLYLALVEKDPSRTVHAMSELGMLTANFNHSVIEQAIQLTIQALHGRKPSEMEVNSLMEIANKTMNKFPFVLPKNLALYMRMGSIIEGIYKTHKVDFKFVNVLKEILEEEHLIKDAYVEELKHSFTKLVKSIDATISIAPELRKFIDDNRSLQLQKTKPKSNILLSGSILSAAVFMGSALIYSSNVSLGISGMIGSLVIMGVFTILSRKQ